MSSLNENRVERGSNLAEKTAKQTVPVSSSEGDSEHAQVISLLGQIVELTTALYDLQGEQLQSVHSIRTRMP